MGGPGVGLDVNLHCEQQMRRGPAKGRPAGGWGVPHRKQEGQAAHLGCVDRAHSTAEPPIMSSGSSH